MSLRECYEQVKGLAPLLDTFEVVKEVEMYREFWKPERRGSPSTRTKANLWHKA